MNQSNPHIAVILSGAGYLDGAEISESVISLLSLDRQSAEVSMFAPDIKQHHVINHLTGEETNESRNVLVEAARIARGNVKPLSKLKASDFDALIIPGGFGVAKNLSDLAFKGADATVIDDFKNILKAFHAAKKPIGAICISPAVIASILAEHAPKLTIGADAEFAKTIEAMGGTHQNCATNNIVVDDSNNIVSCSAYMREDNIAEVAEGIEKLVEKIISLAQARS